MRRDHRLPSPTGPPLPKTTTKNKKNVDVWEPVVNRARIWEILMRQYAVLNPLKIKKKQIRLG